MKKVFIMMAILCILRMVPPHLVSAVSSQTKTLTGVVVKINTNQIVFKTSSAANYTAETWQANLVRRNGAVMQFGEIETGDKVEVRGTVWSDNSVNATYVRNMSLYVHTGTYSGKIASLDPVGKSFVVTSKQYGNQTIHTTSFTRYKKNGSAVTFNDLAYNMSVTVKGQWDRNRADITAYDVSATVRLVSITVTGSLGMKSVEGIAVVGSNNVIYGVDISKAKLVSKNNKTVMVSELNLGDNIRVEGKHASESNQVYATVVKDVSVSK